MRLSVGDGLALDPRRIQHGNFVSLLLTATSKSISGGISRGILAGSLISISAGSSVGISLGISEGWIPEKNPRQKWSIWYLWEHFVVPEHRIPIWVILRLRFGVEDIMVDMEHFNISLYVCNNMHFGTNANLWARWIHVRKRASRT